MSGGDGQVVDKDRTGSMFLPSTPGGGLVGLLIGILGGPFGLKSEIAAAGKAERSAEGEARKELLRRRARE